MGSSFSIPHKQTPVEVRPQTPVEVRLGNNLQTTLHHMNGNNWLGQGNFPSFVEPETAATFSSQQPWKAGAIYKGTNKNGVPCAWLLAFCATEIDELKVYVECGERGRFENVNWEDIKDKLVDYGCTESHCENGATGCTAYAKISKCPTSGGARIACAYGNSG